MNQPVKTSYTAKEYLDVVDQTHELQRLLDDCRAGNVFSPTVQTLRRQVKTLQTRLAASGGSSGSFTLNLDREIVA